MLYHLPVLYRNGFIEMSYISNNITQMTSEIICCMMRSHNKVRMLTCERDFIILEITLSVPDEKVYTPIPNTAPKPMMRFIAGP